MDGLQDVVPDGLRLFGQTPLNRSWHVHGPAEVAIRGDGKDCVWGENSFCKLFTPLLIDGLMLP